MAAILWKAVVHDGLVELVPIAEAQVFEHLGDAVFVTGASTQALVDANDGGARSQRDRQQASTRPLARVSRT